ncbi:MAG: hypothetical protein V1660_02220 [archaeon]
MANRKKRLKKGIESLKKQIMFHEEKREKAKEDGKEELVSYYDDEIKSKEKDIEKKKIILDK